MKNKFLLLGIICLFIACNKQTPFKQVMTGSPIKPVMINNVTGNTFDLADYVPTLINEQFDSQTLTSNTLVLTQKGDTITIPVITAKPHRQILYLVSADEDNIIIGSVDSLDYIPHIEFDMYWQNIKVSTGNISINEHNLYSIAFPKHIGNKHGRSFIRIYAYDKDYNYNDILIPLQDMKPVTNIDELTRHDQQAQVMYSVLVDRFNNGNTANDWKINSIEVLDIADYQGGDLAGITQKIESGFFEELGINTIWVSPITQNPYDAWGYYTFDVLPEVDEDGSMLFDNKYNPHRPYSKYSGYHGYWPILVTKIDQRLGTDEEFHHLIKTAHEHNLNVVLDYVANHVHINSYILQQNPTWITDSILPDGRRNFELWDEARFTTWFDSHIPTLDLSREEVYQPMTDSALFWLQNFDIDGFRHDACKHIPDYYWRTLTQKIKNQFPDRQVWMIGETYGSPELIGSYVKTGMLDAQFDFNVFFTATHAIAEENGDMKEVERVIEESLAAYGAHHTMGNISGNHDQVRFISLAGGAVSFSEDGKRAGWTRDITVGDAAVAYKKAILLQVINLTIPGVPCIYQGDEYGEPGGNDPDNRKMMRFDNLNEQETAMRSQIAELVHLRRNSMALMYGDYLPVYADKDVLCFKRVYMNEEILVAINKSDKEVNIDAGDVHITLQPYQYMIQ